MCSDGAPAMLGDVTGVHGLLKNHLSQFNLPHDVIWYHCIIHQSVLCCKVLDLQNVMDIVIEIVNLIRSYPANHRKFQDMLMEFESEKQDVIYFSKIRWLS